MWALQYWLYLERRVQIEDKQTELELQCYNTSFERWQQLYQSQVSGGDWGMAFGGEAEEPITDPADLDSWYANLSQQRGMNGAEINDRLGENTAVLGVAEGPGRRV